MEQFLGLHLSLINVVLAGLALSAWNAVAHLCGAYSAEIRGRMSREGMRLIASSLLASTFMLLLLFSSHAWTFHVRTVVLFPFFLCAATILLRVAAYSWMSHSSNQVVTLIVGSGQRALREYREISEESPRRRTVMGFVDSNPHGVTSEVAEKMIGTLDDLESLLMNQVVDEVVIALPVRSSYAEIQRVMQICERVGVEHHYPADTFQPSIGKPRMAYGRRTPRVMIKLAPDETTLIVKHLLDRVGAFLGLLLLAPLLLAIAVLIKVSSPGPVFFAQERYGLNRRRFRMFKFRTMVVDAEKKQAQLEAMNEAQGPVFKMKADPRIFPLGRMLRKTSLDELPQLVNVLRGEMSLVGPRPLPVRDVSRFSESWLMRRFSVKPGLTCLWQVTGRSNTSFDYWIRLDLKYIDCWSLGLDLKILAKTLPAVVRGSGAM